MSHLLALENSISSASGHSRDVQKFGAVNHVVICQFDERDVKSAHASYIPSRLATQTPFAST